MIAYLAKNSIEKTSFNWNITPNVDFSIFKVCAAATMQVFQQFLLAARIRVVIRLVMIDF